MILAALLLAAAQPASGAAPVSADPQPAAIAASKAVNTSDRDKLVCRTDVTTGRHIAARVCHTQYDWDRMEADGKAYANRLTGGQYRCGGTVGC